MAGGIPIDPAHNFPTQALLAPEPLHVPDWSAAELPAWEVDVQRRFGVQASLMVALTHAGLRSAPELEVQEGSQKVLYRGSQEKAKGEGRRIGTAFRLPNGEVVYVPDEGSP